MNPPTKPAVITKDPETAPDAPLCHDEKQLVSMAGDAAETPPDYPLDLVVLTRRGGRVTYKLRMLSRIKAGDQFLQFPKLRWDPRLSESDLEALWDVAAEDAFLHTDEDGDQQWAVKVRERPFTEPGCTG